MRHPPRSVLLTVRAAVGPVARTVAPPAPRLPGAGTADANGTGGRSPGATGPPAPTAPAGA